MKRIHSEDLKAYKNLVDTMELCVQLAVELEDYPTPVHSALNDLIDDYKEKIFNVENYPRGLEG